MTTRRTILASLVALAFAPVKWLGREKKAEAVIPQPIEATSIASGAATMSFIASFGGYTGYVTGNTTGCVTAVSFNGKPATLGPDGVWRS